MRLGIVFIQFHVGRLDREFSARAHRIPGIDRQVDDHLFNLSRDRP